MIRSFYFSFFLLGFLTVVFTASMAFKIRGRMESDFFFGVGYYIALLLLLKKKIFNRDYNFYDRLASIIDLACFQIPFYFSLFLVQFVFNLL